MVDIEFQVGERGGKFPFAIRTQLADQFTGVVIAIYIGHLKGCFVFDREAHFAEQGQHRPPSIDTKRQMLQKIIQ